MLESWRVGKFMWIVVVVKVVVVVKGCSDFMKKKRLNIFFWLSTGRANPGRKSNSLYSATDE